MTGGLQLVNCSKLSNLWNICEGEVQTRVSVMLLAREASSIVIRKQMYREENIHVATIDGLQIL